MEAGFFGVHPELHQAVGHRVDDSVAIWGVPGLRPQDVKWSKPYSSLFKYQWGHTHLGRFAASYRQRFGERPSETLKSRRFNLPAKPLGLGGGELAKS